MNHRRGFTLIEVLVAVGLAGMVLTMSVQAWKISLQMSQSAATIRTSSQILSAIMRVVRSDLASTNTLPTAPSTVNDRLYDPERSNEELTQFEAPQAIQLWGNRHGFCVVDASGDLRSLIHSGHRLPDIERRGVKHELPALTSELGLLRVVGRIDSPNDLESHALAGEVSLYECSYLDNHQWSDSWAPSESESIPVAIRVRVRLNSGERAEDVIALRHGERL